MTPKEAVDLPLPWPVLTISRGLSLFDLFLSRCSLGSLASRVSLTLPFSSRSAPRANQPAVPPGAGTAHPSPLPARPPSRAGRSLPRCPQRMKWPRGSVVARRPPAGRVPQSPSHRSAGSAEGGAPCRADPGSFSTEGDHGYLIAALVGIVQEGEYGALDGGHAFAGRHRAARVDQEEDQVPLSPLPDVLTQIAGTNLDPRSLTAPSPLVRRRGPYGRRQRHVPRALSVLPIRDRMPGLTRNAAPAAKRSSLALLDNLEPHRVERIRSCVAPLSGSRLCLRRLSHATRYLPDILARRRRERATVRAFRRVGVFGEGVLQFFGIHARLLERPSSAAVREGQQSGPLHVVENHFGPGIPCGQRTGGLGCNQVAAQAIDAEFRAEGRYPEQDVLVQADAGKQQTGRFHGSRELRVHVRPFSGELPRVSLVA